MSVKNFDNGDKFVDVAGVPFFVKEVESNTRTDSGMGRTDTKMGIITINREMPVEIKQSVLIHEWLHSVLDWYGFEESNDEKLIATLQNELFRAGFRVPAIVNE